MPRQHTIAPGETLAALAAEHGFSRGSHIFEHPDNASLREHRDNPDVLAAGDVVVLPDPVLGTVEVRVDVRHRFQVVRPRQHLRLKPVGCDGLSLDGRRYVLEVEGARFEGVIDGRIEHAIGVGARRARLEVEPESEGQASIIWELEVGHLDPVETAAGLQARLNNLGFWVGPVDADVGPRTEAGIRRFQEAHGLDVDGTNSQEVLDKLREEHGC